MSPIGRDELPGLDAILLRAVHVSSVVLALMVPLTAGARILQGATNPFRSLIYNTIVELGFLSCLLLARTGWGRSRPELLMFMGGSIVNGSLLFAGYHSIDSSNLYVYLALMTPLGIAAFAPLRPSTILLLSVELCVFYPLSHWLFPRSLLMGTPVAATIALGVGVLGALATQTQRRIIADLHRARCDAQAAAKLKSEFLANMSHEVRTPMTAVLGFTEELRLSFGDELSSDHADLFASIERNGQHLLVLINDILDLARAETDQLEFERIACSPLGIVRDAANALERRARERGLEIRISARGELPDEVESDPTRLHQIMLNLLQNAIKFTETGYVGITVAVEPMFETNQARLAVEVADTGIGIDPHALEQIFEPFRQADASTRRRFGGAGLGLTVSRRLARLLGGELLAQSAPGQGSVFRLEVPVSLPPVRKPGEPLPAAEAPIPTDNLRGRVLLAEDGPDNQRLITRILKRAGLDVDVAGDGAVAFAKAMAAREVGMPYDVILMDMSMPEVDGYEATRRLRAAGYDWPIVALTAHAMSGDRELCMEAGCDAYLSKPIHRPLLLTTLAVALRKQADNKS